MKKGQNKGQKRTMIYWNVHGVAHVYLHFADSGKDHLIQNGLLQKNRVQTQIIKIKLVSISFLAISRTKK